MVLGAEGAENELLSEWNSYDATQGFPLKIKNFPINDFGSIVTSCMFLVLLGGISLWVSEKVSWSKKLFQKIWLGEEKMQQKIRRIFYQYCLFFCGFQSDSVKRTTVCTGVGGAEADSPVRQNGGRNDGYRRASGFGNRQRSRSG